MTAGPDRPPVVAAQPAAAGREVVGWSMLLAPGWWHVAINDRRASSVRALLDQLLASLPRDRVTTWRRQLTSELDALLDQAAAQGATDVYLLADLRYGVPVAASCLATVAPTAAPAGTPAQVLALTYATKGARPGVVTVGGRECACVRRREVMDVAAAAPVVPPARTAGSSQQGEQPPSPPITVTQWQVFVPFPDGARTLVLSFSTPLDPLADALVTLFEAMAGSLRWTREKA